MTDFELRVASHEDGEFAFRVKEAAFRYYVEQVWTWIEAEQRQLHERRFREQDVRVIRVAGSDVGFIALATTPDALHVNQLFLLPEFQGRGFGRQCMLCFMEEARAKGLPVRLRVLKVNPRACEFYQRLGFRLVGATDTHDLMKWA